MSDQPKTLKQLVNEGFYDGFASESLKPTPQIEFDDSGKQKPKTIYPAFGAACLAELQRAGVDVNGSPSGIGHLIQSLFQIGLTPSQHAGLIWVVPYGGKPTVTLGYKGYIKLGYDSGYLCRITPQVVLDGEPFAWTETSAGPVLQHTIPTKRAEARPENIELAYVSWTSNTGLSNAVRVEGHAIRAIHAKSGKSSPWRQPGGFYGMALKTPIRAAAKFWNLSAEIRAALALEDENDEQELPEIPSADNGAAARAALEAAGIKKP